MNPMPPGKPTIYTQRFTAPSETVFNAFLTPAFLSRIWPCRFRPESPDADPEAPQTPGEIRHLTVTPLIRIDQLIEATEAPRLIEYTVVKGSVLGIRDHLGRIELAPDGDETQMVYSVYFGSTIPGLAPVLKPFIRFFVSRGIAKAAKIIK